MLSCFVECSHADLISSGLSATYKYISRKGAPQYAQRAVINSVNRELGSERKTYESLPSCRVIQGSEEYNLPILMDGQNLTLR
jgi:hypothetical protein